MPDPIVMEIRRIRDADAARFNHDLDATFRDIRDGEPQSGKMFIPCESDETIPNPLPSGCRGRSLPQGAV